MIRTSYGFHIIRVEGKQDARLKPLDEVKPEIEPILKKQKAAAEAQKLANTVQGLARTNGMDKAAAQRNMTVTTTEMIAQTDQLPGVGNSPDLMANFLRPRKSIRPR